MNRYQRQILIPEIGTEGQEKLSRAKVLIVGAGGLGSPLALYLTAAGVGTIGIMDDDEVSESNLNRQILYTEQDLGASKAPKAGERLRALNSNVQVNVYAERLTASNAHEIIAQYDIVADACDNTATRYLISDVTAELGIPYVYGAIRALEGQVSVFNVPLGAEKPWSEALVKDAVQPSAAAPASSITYRDLWPEEQAAAVQEINQEQGDNSPFKAVLGSTAGVIASIQATEVVKLIVGFGEHLNGKLWVLNLQDLTSQILEL